MDLGIRRGWAARWYKNTCFAGTKVQLLTQKALLGHPKPYRPGFRDFHEKENRPKPTRIAPELFGGDGISMAACGLGFTCAATYEGHCYTWGLGKHGVLGHNNECDRRMPPYYYICIYYCICKIVGY